MKDHVYCFSLKMKRNTRQLRDVGEHQFVYVVIQMLYVVPKSKIYLIIHLNPFSWRH